MKHLSPPATTQNSSPSPKIYHIRKGDILLFSGFLLLAFLLFVGYQFFFQKPGSSVEVTIDGKVTKTLPLTQDTTYEIISGEHQKNILIIKNGSASISDANCPDKLCVHQKKINKKGETLVCLPHKVVVSVISSEEEKEFDGIAN